MFNFAYRLLNTISTVAAAAAAAKERVSLYPRQLTLTLGGAQLWGVKLVSRPENQVSLLQYNLLFHLTFHKDVTHK